MLGFAKRLLASFALTAALSTGAFAQPRQPPKDDPWLRVQLQEARTRIDGLQEELRRIQNGVKLTEAQFQPPAKADLAVIDAMSSAFLLTSVHVWIDDVLVYRRDDGSAALGSLREVHLPTGPIAPGDHVARIALQLRGNGAVLPYMRAYRFELTSSHKFSASLGRTTSVSVRAFEHGDATTPYVHVPGLEWEEWPDAARTAPQSG